MNEATKDTYTVVVNQKGQYSIFPVSKQIPSGWTDVGRSGTRVELLAYIKETWADMRPVTLRREQQIAQKQVSA